MMCKEEQSPGQDCDMTVEQSTTMCCSLTHHPTPNKLVGVMLGCCMARRAAQWSPLIKT